MGEAARNVEETGVKSKSKFIDALRGVKSDAPPMWMMRQAGRYLPEYRKLREGNSMLQMVMTPELACEVTLQPLRRFPLDAAIIFADILTPLIGMGINLEFKKGEGPVIDNPVRTAHDVANLRVPTPRENVGYTLDAIRMVVSELGGKTPLIGFCGAPFTLACYLIQGESPGDLEYTKGLMVGEPETWHALQTKLVKLSADYLVAQVEAGCESLQIFDSWLGFVGPREYDRFVEPYLRALVDDVRSRVSVPVVFSPPVSLDCSRDSQSFQLMPSGSTGVCRCRRRVNFWGVIRHSKETSTRRFWRVRGTMYGPRPRLSSTRLKIFQRTFLT